MSLRGFFSVLKQILPKAVRKRWKSQQGITSYVVENVMLTKVPESPEVDVLFQGYVVNEMSK